MGRLQLLGVGKPTVGSVTPSTGNPQSNSIANGTSVSKTNYTPASGSNRIVVVELSLNPESSAPTSITVTFGGVSMTHVTSSPLANGLNCTVAMLYIREADFPSTPADVSASWTNSCGAVLNVYTIKDVNQTTPFGTVATATGNSTTPSVSVTSETGNLVVDAVAMVAFTSDTFTVGSGQTSISSLHSGAGESIRGACSYESGASSVTMSWSNSSSFTWAILGVSVNPT